MLKFFILLLYTCKRNPSWYYYCKGRKGQTEEDVIKYTSLQSADSTHNNHPETFGEQTAGINMT